MQKILLTKGSSHTKRSSVSRTLYPCRGVVTSGGARGEASLTSVVGSPARQPNCANTAARKTTERLNAPQTSERLNAPHVTEPNQDSNKYKKQSNYLMFLFIISFYMEIKSNQIMKHKYCIICDVPFCRSASKKERRRYECLYGIQYRSYQYSSAKTVCFKQKTVNIPPRILQIFLTQQLI